ncbi:MAG: hypothetical protein CMC05_01790, partial [Flavobacteriaceae bacterium]|nr:hypothetical protein [Flavobacteriaceae bacterium]
DDAEASYNQAIVLKPDYFEAYYNLGNTLSVLNDDYEDTLGDALSHDFASKNCIATSINGESYNFNVTYDNSNRISTRAYEISLEADGVSLTTEFNEIFTYAN